MHRAEWVALHGQAVPKFAMGKPDPWMPSEFPVPCPHCIEGSQWLGSETWDDVEQCDDEVRCWQCCGTNIAGFLAKPDNEPWSQ